MTTQMRWDYLLDLDGTALVIDNELGFRVKFDSPDKLLADFWQQVDRVLKEHEDD